ncbi:hypothetical protein HMPREF3181_01465 [Parvimonas sp. KA00067]|nr:hypothetical protein [Parvimonas sp. KA00067]KXB64469.1 hypothetical protein HMPREF3181_01465 [Parvimonas sp. KA00067]
MDTVIVFCLFSMLYLLSYKLDKVLKNQKEIKEEIEKIRSKL